MQSIHSSDWLPNISILLDSILLDLHVSAREHHTDLIPVIANKNQSLFFFKIILTGTWQSARPLYTQTVLGSHPGGPTVRGLWPRRPEQAL